MYDWVLALDRESLATATKNYAANLDTTISYAREYPLLMEEIGAHLETEFPDMGLADVLHGRSEFCKLAVRPPETSAAQSPATPAKSAAAGVRRTEALRKSMMAAVSAATRIPGY